MTHPMLTGMVALVSLTVGIAGCSATLREFQYLRRSSTDADGRFSLNGSFDETTEIRARKQGYVVEIKTLGLRCDSCASWSLTFSLAQGKAGQLYPVGTHF